ncbi:MAG: hypothetical protein ABIS36_08945, partial [Chryseolinea sp.]
VLETIQKSAEVYEWFINEWVRLIAVDPETREMYLFGDGQFKPYKTLAETVGSITDVMPLIEKTQENLPIYQLV